MLCVIVLFFIRMVIIVLKVSKNFLTSFRLKTGLLGKYILLSLSSKAYPTCWCICNFRIYSLVYFIYCISLVLNVPIGRIINLMKSCKFIEINSPLYVGGKSPHSWGALGLLDSPRKVSPGGLMSSHELV